jgi:uncharacterized repeat protein (TIGR01451 family)
MKIKNKCLPAIGLSLLITAAQWAPAALAAAVIEPLHECHGLTIRMTGPATAKTGDLIRYKIRVSNGSTCRLQSATGTDFLPREASLVDAHPEPRERENRDPETGHEPRLPVSRVEWRGLGLIPAESKTFEVRVTVKAAAGREITNTACVEHPKAGRRCETLDTLIQAGRPIGSTFE